MVNAPERIGRYLLFNPLASGGMATVHLGRLIGPVGFSRTIAVKRLHPHLARQPEFVSMFLDEARLAARIRHPNVVPIFDVVALRTELFLVMEYVSGVSLSRLIKLSAKLGQRIPAPIALSIVHGALSGLHAAHQAKGEGGAALGIVHRDVSPQNILVGVDGMAHVVDFGIALAAERVQVTNSKQIKGKVQYMAREQLLREPVDRRTDVFAASAVLWEALTGRRLFRGEDDFSTMKRVLLGAHEAPSTHAPEISAEIDAVVMRGLAGMAKERWSSAAEMAEALERTGVMASSREVTRWLERVAGDDLEQRAEIVAEIETYSGAGTLEEVADQLSEHVLPPGVDTREFVPPSDVEHPTPTGITPPTRVGDAEDRLWAEHPVPGLPEPPNSSHSHTAVTLPSQLLGMAVRELAEAKRRAGRADMRWKLVAAGFAGVMFVGLMTSVIVAVSSHEEPVSVAMVRLAPAVAARVSVVAAPTVEAIDPNETIPTSPLPPVEPAAPPTPPPPTTQRPAAGGLPKPLKARRDPCDPPYTIDAEGVRVPKRHCFK